MALFFGCVWFDYATIEKIYLEINYPDFKFYLMKGLINLGLILVSYGVFLTLIRNDRKLNEFISKKNNNAQKEINDEGEFERLYIKVWKCMKIKMIIYYLFASIICIFCFLYLTCFCAVYTGTTKYMFLLYGTNLVLVVSAKIVYGLVLGIFRFIALVRK